MAFLRGWVFLGGPSTADVWRAFSRSQLHQTQGPWLSVQVFVLQVCACVSVCVHLKFDKPYFNAQKNRTSESHKEIYNSNKPRDPAANRHKFCFTIFVQVTMKMHFMTEVKLVHLKSQETLSFYSLSAQLDNKNRHLPDVRWVNEELEWQRKG